MNVFDPNYDNPYCKGEFLVEALGIERKAAARYLRQLEETGILQCRKIGTENIFLNKQLIQLLKM